MKANYSAFSEVYNQLFDKSLYPQWLDYVKRELAYHKVDKDPQDLTILDLGCGDGELACLMAEEGYQVMGLDLSEEMIDIAADKAYERGLFLPFVIDDMRSFESPHSFQVITCFCDSLCYLNSEDEVRACFSACYQAMEQGGVFLFDVLSEYQVNVVYDDFQWVQEWEDAVFTWRSEQVRGVNTVDHLLNIFIENEDGLYTRDEERHEETTFPVDTYQRLLTEAGFTSVHVTADFENKKPTEKSERIFFSCKK